MSSDEEINARIREGEWERAREKERRDDVLKSYKRNGEESCGVCRFENRDYCKRFPPQVVGTGRNSVTASTEHPRVYLHDWCGEFKLSNKFVDEHGEG